MKIKRVDFVEPTQLGKWLMRALWDPGDDVRSLNSDMKGSRPDIDFNPQTGVVMIDWCGRRWGVPSSGCKVFEFDLLEMADNGFALPPAPDLLTATVTRKGRPPGSKNKPKDAAA